MDEFLVQIKNESLKMLSCWSADILEIWTEVYAMVLSQIVTRNLDSNKDDIFECKKTVYTMMDKN